MLESIPFLVLLPLVVLAYILGMQSAQKRQVKTPAGSQNFSSEYFKGLNYLLNEQTDKAIDVFMRMLEVGEDTVDTHITLGNLYRQRGEVEQAIKIHQNVIAKPSLDIDKRNQALYELARDFMTAGLLDRAENLFNELLQKNAYVIHSLNNLLDIYQQEKDWERAIEIARRLESATHESHAQIIAHFYCELAEKELARGNDTATQRLIKRALETDRQCVRASLLEGKIAFATKNYKVAALAYKRVEQQDCLMIPEMLEPLLNTYAAMGNDGEVKSYLNHILSTYSCITAIILYAEQVRVMAGDREAALFLVEALRKKPSVKGLNHLIEISLNFTSGSARENLLILRELTSRLIHEKPVYQCRQCGFKGKTLHWQCPSCKSWSSIRPVQGIEGE